MHSKLVCEADGLKTFAVVFDKGDQVPSELMKFAKSSGCADAQLTAIGAFSEVTLGYFDPKTKKYKNIPMREQVEVLSFSGNLVEKEGKPQLHAHVVVGKDDGTAHGGHFIAGRVWPTLEMMVAELPVHLRRVHDRETGLALIDLAA